jgi:predicted transcriptional regulator
MKIKLEDLINDYKNLSLKEMKKKWNIGANTMYKILKTNNIALKGKKGFVGRKRIKVI